MKLIADASIPGSDYINASYVSVSCYFIYFLIKHKYNNVTLPAIENKKFITTSIDLMYQFITTLGIPCFIHEEVEAPNRDCNLPNNHFTNKRQMYNFKLHIPWTFHYFWCLWEDHLYTVTSANFSKKISQMDSHVHTI